MKNVLTTSSLVAVSMLSTAAFAQDAQLPTSEATVGSFEVPIVIIPEQAFQEAETPQVQTGSSNLLTITLSEESVTDFLGNFPTTEAELVNLVALTSFLGSANPLVENALSFGEDLPSVGTASFAGQTEGTVATAETLASVSGDVSIAVDFASGAVDSNFTNMTQQVIEVGSNQGPLGVTAWRDFSSGGSLFEGSNTFSGSASTTDGVLSGSVAGTLDGVAGAQGLWSLSGATESAFGSFQAAAD